MLQHHRRVNTGQHHTEYITANTAKLKVVIKQSLQTVSNFQQELIAYLYAKAGRHIGEAHHINQHQRQLVVTVPALRYFIDERISIGDGCQR